MHRKGRIAARATLTVAQHFAYNAAVDRLEKTNTLVSIFSGQAQTSLIRRASRSAICLVALLISACGDLQFGDEIRVQPANGTTPISQADIVTVKQVFDQAATEFNLVPASAADIEAVAKWSYTSPDTTIAQYNFRDPLQLSQDGFHSDHSWEVFQSVVKYPLKPAPSWPADLVAKTLAHQQVAAYLSRSVFDSEKMVIWVCIWREHNTIDATVGLHRRRDEIIRRLVELLNSRLGPDRAKHVVYHYWSFA